MIYQLQQYDYLLSNTSMEQMHMASPKKKLKKGNQLKSSSKAQPNLKKHRAYLLVRVQPGKDSDVLSGVQSIPQVLNADIVYGAADLIIHVTFDEFEELQQIVYDLVHSLKGIEDTDTCFVSSLLP